MRRKTELPELLCPAGSFECLCAAIEGGADAVYVGGKKFGARAYAKNFDEDELSRAVKYCHLYGVKLYVALNVLIDDKEISEVLSYVRSLYKMGVDALIVADLGIIKVIRECLPDFEIHASTQMSVHNLSGAEAACSLGAVRVVPARELPFEDIKTLIDESSAEIEVFLHGALCVCHSGQCLFSSLVGGRSGNRGECAQPCRMPYNGRYPLSLKDLSLAGHIKELIDSGVSSLKIEGRMKSASYVYTVTKIYRRLLDEARNSNESENRALRRAFSRDGFTDGYFVGRPDMPMTGVRREEDKKDSRAIEGQSFSPKKKKVWGSVEIKAGVPARFTLTNGVKSVSVLGDVPNAAESFALTRDGVCERLSKMGNTLLSLSPSDITAYIEEGLNLSPASLNKLRRTAAEALEYTGREAPDVKYKPSGIRKDKRGGLVTALFFSESEYISIMKKDEGALSEFDITFIPLTSQDSSFDKTNGIYIPPVIFDHELGFIEERLKVAKEKGVLYALVGNIGHISIAKANGFIPIGDFRLNVTNADSRDEYFKMGVEHIILSPELTLPKARDIGGSVIVYGRIPLMITERCYIKEGFGCSKCSQVSLVDRKGESFPIIREFDHRNIILNSSITYVGDKRPELDKSKVRSYHFIFSKENARQIKSAVSAFAKGEKLSGEGNVRRIGRRQTSK